MIDNKVKDKELLDMTLEYRKTLEKEFLYIHKIEAGVFDSVLETALMDNFPIFTEAKKANKPVHKMPEYKEAHKEINNRDDVKKFDIIEQHYKDTNNLLEKYIKVEVY